MNEGIARRVHQLLLQASSAIDTSVAALEDAGIAGEELRDYQQAAGRVLAGMWDELLRPLYDEHPALIPAESNYVPRQDGPTSTRKGSDVPYSGSRPGRVPE